MKTAQDTHGTVDTLVEIVGGTKVPCMAESLQSGRLLAEMSTNENQVESLWGMFSGSSGLSVCNSCLSQAVAQK